MIAMMIAMIIAMMIGYEHQTNVRIMAIILIFLNHGLFSI